MMCRLLVPVILLTLALPSVAHTQESSPPAATSIGLATMLARAPAELPELEDPERATIAYANIAA